MVLVSYTRSQFLFRIPTDCRYSLRPVTSAGHRVTPTELWAHRRTHDFRTPCCLCAHETGGVYTECDISQALDGEYYGEYVARCTYGRCGYLSTWALYFHTIREKLNLDLVGIERMYTRLGLLVDRYPTRGTFDTKTICVMVLIVSSALQLRLAGVQAFPHLVILKPCPWRLLVGILFLIL
jgi:hypothetical protein